MKCTLKRTWRHARAPERRPEVGSSPLFFCECLLMFTYERTYLSEMAFEPKLQLHYVDEDWHGRASELWLWDQCHLQQGSDDGCVGNEVIAKL